MDKKDRDDIQYLIKEASKIPKLEYTDNLVELLKNVNKTIRAVKTRLGTLETLQCSIEYVLTKSHLDNEEVE